MMTSGHNPAYPQGWLYGCLGKVKLLNPSSFLPLFSWLKSEYFPHLYLNSSYDLKVFSYILSNNPHNNPKR